ELPGRKVSCARRLARGICQGVGRGNKRTMATTESAATSAGLNLSIDRMTEHDLVEVCQIEDLSGLSAWGWDAYHHELQSRGDSIMLVARIDSTFYEYGLAGFIVARLIAD